LAFSLIKHPVLCNYYVTYRCNASCSFCDIWEKPSPYVTLKEVDENLIALKKLGVKVIDFTGGEPLLNRELPEFLALAKEKGFITTVTTNGLLYPKYAEVLKGKIDMLHFSLDSADREKHNASRNVNCYDHVMDSIRIAKELGEKPDILFTVMPGNISEIETVYHEISIKNDLVLILNPIFNYNGISEVDDFTTEQLENLSAWGKKKKVFLNQAFIALRKNGGNDIKDPACFAGENTIVISPQNKLITPCYHLGLEEFEIEESLDQTWKKKEVQDSLKKGGRDEKCQNCTINCYMQPSFSTHVNKYFFKSLPSTLKYNRLKGTWKQLF